MNRYIKKVLTMEAWKRNARKFIDELEEFEQNPVTEDDCDDSYCDEQEPDILIARETIDLERISKEK